MSEIGTMEYLNEAKALCAELFPKRYFPNVGKSPVFFGRKEKILAIGKKAIVDYNNDNLFCIASDEYKLVRHEEICKQVHDASMGIPEYGIPELNLSLPYSGAKMVLEVKFPEVTKEVKVGDEVIPRIVFRSSYDLQWKMKGEGGVHRKICSNGAMIPVKGKQFSYVNRHVSTLDLEAAINIMKEGLIAFSNQTELWKQWAEISINNEDYSNIWEALPFSEAEQSKMEELPEAGTKLLLPEALERHELNLYDFHNVVSQFVTHNIESENRKADIEPLVARTFDHVYIRRMSS